MHVAVSVQVRRPGISGARLRRIVAHVMKRERAPKDAGVSIALVNDPAMRWLNRRYLGKDMMTDVLAFPLLEPSPRGRRKARSASRTLGEVCVCVDRARLQAEEAGHSARTEIALLAVHGVLHLLGYDDRTRRGANRMMRRTRTLLAEVGEEVRG